MHGWEAQHPTAVALAEVVARAIVAPLVGFYRLRLIAFRSVAQALSLAPGGIGRLLRRAWYTSTLASCGRRLQVQFGTVLREPRTRIGDDCVFGEFNSVGFADVGSYFVSADHVSIVGGRHQQRFAHRETPVRFQPAHVDCVKIGEDVWVGAHATLASSVAAHTLIGANAAVVETFPEWSILAGVPARVIGERP